MKIGIVLPYDIFKGGGVRSYVLEIQAELLRRGHDTWVITPQPRAYDGEAPDGILFVGGSADMKAPTHTTIQVSASGDPDAIHAVLAEHDFDLLHFHEPWVPILSRQILSRSNTVNVATFHAKMPDTAVSKTIEKVITPYTKSILKYIDVMTTVSVPASEYISQLTDQKLHFISNGVDLKKYKPKKQPKLAAPTIFYVGRLEKRKGVKYLIRAFALVEQQLPQARLVIGGEGPDRKKLEMLAVELGVNNIEFLGLITDDEKIKWMQSTDVFCAPAIFGEAFGIVLIEALACGAPVVAGANPGYASVLTGRGAMGLVNPYDQVDFARRLLLHLQDPGIKAYWNEWSQEYIKQFDYVTIVDQYEALYKQAIKDHRR
ncbi:glycosyltransferase family 4 protein [Aeromicrobium sp.]|nr:glycosyltransferase family 4 protein [Candidatus Saccharibacteria bacterium]